MDPLPPTRSPGPRGRPVVAWTAIVLAALGLIAINALGARAPADTQDDALGLVLSRIQSQYLVGIGKLARGAGSIYEQAAVLDAGSVGQRMRFVPLAAELAGPREAGQALLRFADLVDFHQQLGSPGAELTTTQEGALRVLERLYLDEAGELPIDSSDELLVRIENLTEPERHDLVDELGWFGHLALAPDGVDASDRDEVLAPTRRIVVVFVGGFALLALAGGAGLIGLVVVAVLLASRRLKHGLGPGRAPHGVYAETFAIWLVGFFGLQMLAALAAGRWPELGLLASVVAFLASLLALGWPRLRGLPWRVIAEDIGWTRGAGPGVELLVGAGGYFLMLPLLGIGVVFTLVLLILQSTFAPVTDPFVPAAGPAHPIILQLAEANVWARLQVLLLAAVAAPLVEETMFRGVLYRQLRDWSGRLGTWLGVLVSGTISSFVFAAIHPQGWVAIPALMSLAWAFVLLREWRGTLVPSMVVHGISNAVVMISVMTMVGL